MSPETHYIALYHATIDQVIENTNMDDYETHLVVYKKMYFFTEPKNSEIHLNVNKLNDYSKILIFHLIILVAFSI